MTRGRSCLLLPLVLCVLRAGHGNAAQSIPIHQVAPADATASEPLDSAARVFETSAGRVFVALRTRILLYDAGLKQSTRVIDSSGVTAGPGGRPATNLPIIPYLGDSTLVVDGFARLFLVVDPDGHVTRAMAAPKSADVLLMTGSGAHVSANAAGVLTYRGTYPPPPRGTSPSGLATIVPPPDTFPIVKADFSTRRVDTLATISAPSGVQISGSIENGKLTMAMVIQPLPVIDDWAQLSDGSVAIVRGRDYHIDWIDPAGTRVSAPRLPFDWRRITDDDKAKIIDSLRALQMETRRRADSANVAQGGKPTPPGFAPTYAPLSDMPDHYPPIRANAVLADRDEHVWILPATSLSARGGLLYDVVDRQKGLLERVQMPAGCSVAGFGARGAVYMICGTALMRTHVVR